MKNEAMTKNEDRVYFTRTLAMGEKNVSVEVALGGVSKAERDRIEAEIGKFLDAVSLAVSEGPGESQDAPSLEESIMDSFRIALDLAKSSHGICGEAQWSNKSRSRS